MIAIIPTVLAYTKPEFDARFARILPIADEIQVDLMDGTFVETTSVALKDVPDVHAHAGKRFEAHLMVVSPGAWIEPLVERGFARIIVHYEALAPDDIPAVAARIRGLGATPVLALNPETPVDEIVPHARHFDTVLFLGVHPGRNGAPYVEETPARIRALRKRLKGITIQVDGGMTPRTISDVVAAGATRINSGSFVSSAADPRAALQALHDAVR